MSKLKKVEPKPFGRIGLVAMSKKEHDSVGNWALQQKRRCQLNNLLSEFYEKAPLGMPNPATGKYDDNNPSLIDGGFFSLSDWNEAIKDLG